MFALTVASAGKDLGSPGCLILLSPVLGSCLVESNFFSPHADMLGAATPAALGPRGGALARAAGARGAAQKGAALGAGALLESFEFFERTCVLP
jgi:hypothetical protein